MATERPTPTQSRLLADLHAGGVLRRRGMHSRAADQNHWLGPRSRAYTAEARATADGLVRRGLARWVPVTDPHELATHRLISTALPAPAQAHAGPRRNDVTNSTLPTLFPFPALFSGVENGIVWAVCEAPIYGAANDYVQVPEGHPWQGKGYDDIDVFVHGGLTYAEGDWVGFDTLHSGDYWPGQGRPKRPYEREWTVEQVVEVTRQLARDAAAAAANAQAEGVTG